MMSRLELLNNPFGIRKTAIDWKGEVFSPDHDFEKFETMALGIRAGCKNFIAYQDKHGLKTVPELIDRHAPPVENNTAAYIADVENRMDVGNDTILDLHKFDDLFNLACAVISHENGHLEIPLETIEEGVRAALA